MFRVLGTTPFAKACLAIIAYLGVVGALRAAVLYDNLGGQEEFVLGYLTTIEVFDYNGTDLDYYQRMGMSFVVPDQDYLLESLKLPLLRWDGATGLDVYLYSDDGGLPGIELYHLADSSMIWPSTGDPDIDLDHLKLTTLTPAAAVELSANAKYWVVIQPNSDGNPSTYYWLCPSTDNLGNAAVNSNRDLAPSDEWHLTGSVPDNGMMVTAVAVPEPNATALLIFTVGVISTICTRGRRVSSTDSSREI